jgi:uncharacterized protein YjbI with pentapeptide repeats
MMGVRVAGGVKQRWYTEQGRDLTADVVARLRAGESVISSFGEIGGRADLRGISLTSRELTGVRLRGLDLRSAQLAFGSLIHASADDCRFDQAHCQDLKLRGTEVRDCSFRKANLRGASLGIWHAGKGSRLERVDFSGARMKRMSTLSATYVDCDFSGAELIEVNFWQSSLVRCKFAGPLREVIFDGRNLGEPKEPNPMHDVDMREAVLQGCDFRGVDFDRVLLPHDDQVILLRDPELVRYAATLLPTESPELVQRARAALGVVLERLVNGPVLVNLRDFPVTGDLLQAALLAAGQG